MATYKFNQFQASITNPTTTIVGVHDSMNESCSVDIKLVAGSTELGVTLDGFTYNETWEDSDINSWVASELQNYAI